MSTLSVKVNPQLTWLAELGRQLAESLVSYHNPTRGYSSSMASTRRVPSRSKNSDNLHPTRRVIWTTRRVVLELKKIALDSPSCMNNLPSPSITEFTLKLAESTPLLTGPTRHRSKGRNRGLATRLVELFFRLAESQPCNYSTLDSAWIHYIQMIDLSPISWFTT